MQVDSKPGNRNNELFQVSRNARERLEVGWRRWGKAVGAHIRAGV